MSEGFRPHESASIDESLRVRLEGEIEVLEDALPLLDSLRYLLARAENAPDDVATLTACATQLPRIDEAIEKVNRHEQAFTLTHAVGVRKEHALTAANDRLDALGHAPAPSLRGAIVALLDLLKREGTAPLAVEKRLAESGGRPWLGALTMGAIPMIPGYMVGGLTLALIQGALTFALWLHFRTPRQWVLLADRLYLPARWPRLAREISPRSIKRLELDGWVKVHVGSEIIKLEAAKPERLFSQLRLLGGTWLSGLRPCPADFQLIDATDDPSQEPGRALLSNEGVLFIPAKQRAAVVKALTPEKLPAEPTLDELLELIAHLPEGRWDALGEHLEKSADAKWLRSDDAELEENVIRVGEKRVRLLLSNAPRRFDAERILKAF